MILKGKEHIRLLVVVLSAILLFTFNAAAFADGPGRQLPGGRAVCLSDAGLRTHLPALRFSHGGLSERADAGQRVSGSWRPDLPACQGRPAGLAGGLF